MNPDLIFWPMIALALATLYLYLPMSFARVKGVKSGEVKPNVYKHNIGEPEESLRFNRAIINQYETPVLFYAVCIASYVTDTVSSLTIVLAFVYGLAKLVHIVIHVTSNRLKIRRPVFIVTYVALILLWLVFAAGLTGLV